MAFLRLLAFAVVAPLGGCTGVQSTFSAFGVEAESTRAITVGMTIAAAVITLGVRMARVSCRTRARGPARSRARDARNTLVGGIGPTVLLATLLADQSLPTMRTLRPRRRATSRSTSKASSSGGASGTRPTDGEPVETANEIRVPVGRTVRFALASPDVIHSFWIPGSRGQDGHDSRAHQRARRARDQDRRFRGACAEFCGLSHARMAFDVDCDGARRFRRWLADRRVRRRGTQTPGRKLVRRIRLRRLSHRSAGMSTESRSVRISRISDPADHSAPARCR